VNLEKGKIDKKAQEEQVFSRSRFYQHLTHGHESAQQEAVQTDTDDEQFERCHAITKYAVEGLLTGPWSFVSVYAVDIAG